MSKETEWIHLYEFHAWAPDLDSTTEAELITAHDELHDETHPMSNLSCALVHDP